MYLIVRYNLSACGKLFKNQDKIMNETLAKLVKEKLPNGGFWRSASPDKMFSILWICRYFYKIAGCPPPTCPILTNIDYLWE